MLLGDLIGGSGVSRPCSREMPKYPHARSVAALKSKRAVVFGGLVPGLRGAPEEWIYGDVPWIKQSFRDVAPVPISLAPAAELIRKDIGLWRQVQLPDLQLEFGGKGWSSLHETAPVGIAAPTSHKCSTSAGGLDHTPASSNRRIAVMVLRSIKLRAFGGRRVLWF